MNSCYKRLLPLLLGIPLLQKSRIVTALVEDIAHPSAVNPLSDEANNITNILVPKLSYIGYNNDDVTIIKSLIRKNKNIKTNVLTMITMT